MFVEPLTRYVGSPLIRIRLDASVITCVALCGTLNRKQDFPFAIKTSIIKKYMESVSW